MRLPMLRTTGRLSEKEKFMASKMASARRVLLVTITSNSFVSRIISKALLMARLKSDEKG